MNVRLARLEYEVKTQEQTSSALKSTQDKLFQQFIKTNTEMTKLLYEIKLEMKDKEDRHEPSDGN
ncbi:MAG: hypothetical protein WBA74_25380 [Cyclobacteriaceae bacterium]